MFSVKETKKIIEFNRLKKKYEKLYEEVSTIIEKRYEELECGDEIGNIVDKTEIPQTAQKNEDGTYTTYNQIGEDWGSGIVYLPLNGHEEYIEIYYST